MKVQNVMNCIFSSWYPTFKNITIKSHILPLPPEFLNYLHQDGLVLPESSYKPYSFERGSNNSDSGDDETDWESAESTTIEAPQFPEFEAQIRESIEALGSSVFPKLNWSAPRDASWISVNYSLKCSTPGDIYLLLKSSDFISHDLTKPFQLCEDREGEAPSALRYELVLRKWCDIPQGMEFRCFVKNKQLIAISQRDISSYYGYLAESKAEIVEAISNLYNNKIAENFPDDNFTFDIFRSAKGKIWLLDFNPYGEVTDSLLFDWSELKADEPLLRTHELSPDMEPVFRYINSISGIQPNPYQQYAVPVDILHWSSGKDPQKLIDLLSLRISSEDEDSEGS